MVYETIYPPFLPCFLCGLEIGCHSLLRRLRSDAGLSQEALTAKMQLCGCNTTRDIYVQMESGRYNMRISELLVLKEIFRCNLDDFFLNLPTPKTIMQAHSTNSDSQHEDSNIFSIS